MERVEEYLRVVMDENCIVTPFDKVDSLPAFLQEAYHFSRAMIAGRECLLAAGKGPLEITRIQKHFRLLRQNAGKDPVLVLPEIRAEQRRRLVEGRVPFIVPGTQLYLPFVGIDFNERYPAALEERLVLTATEQTLFLFLFYQEIRPWGASEAAERIGVAAMSVSRAFRRLESIGAVERIGRGTRTKFVRAGRRTFYEKVAAYLSTPVFKVFYLEEEYLPPDSLVAGDEALAVRTMLGASAEKTVAMSKALFQTVRKKAVLPGDWFGRTCVRVEVWKYDPRLFATDAVVDDLSLILSAGKADDRVVIETEKLLGELLCEE